eukprot:2713001-Rhodomonas_salina.4
MAPDPTAPTSVPHIASPQRLPWYRTSTPQRLSQYHTSQYRSTTQCNSAYRGTAHRDTAYGRTAHRDSVYSSTAQCIAQGSRDRGIVHISVPHSGSSIGGDVTFKAVSDPARFRPRGRISWVH